MRKLAHADADLVRRFVSGDENAFTEIVDRHRPKLLKVAYGHLKNQADAEEIVQDTFIRAHRGLSQFRGESSLATWLHRVTANLARNRYWYYRSRRKECWLSLHAPLGNDATSTFSDIIPDKEHDAPPREAMRTEFVEAVATCMEQLPADDREILKMRNVLNQSHEAIALTLGMGVGTVKSRIARARGELRTLMARSFAKSNERPKPREWFEPYRATRG